MSHPCPLCGAPESILLQHDEERQFLHCGRCDLIFVPSNQRPGAEQARHRYEQHRNEPGDAGYRRFLAQLAEPLIAGVRRGARGLDYGCGPAPVLAEMLTAEGMEMRCYDPFFSADTTTLDATYDFVTCTEVVEHVGEAAALFDRLARLLSGGGKLAIMTQWHEGESAFASWWYRRDITHVCFYSQSTMHWIASDRGWPLSIPAPNVAIFTLPAS